MTALDGLIIGGGIFVASGAWLVWQFHRAPYGEQIEGIGYRETKQKRLRKLTKGLCFTHFWRNPCPYCEMLGEQDPLITKLNQIAGNPHTGDGEGVFPSAGALPNQPSLANPFASDSCRLRSSGFPGAAGPRSPFHGAADTK